MSKVRKGAVMLLCSALLAWVTMSSAFAAGPSPKVVKPADSGMYHVCLATTEFSNPHLTDVTFSGTMKNNCGDDATSPGLTLAITPYEICEGRSTADPARRTTVTLTNGQQKSYSNNIIGQCLDCNTSTHKIVGAPEFQIGAKVTLSGRTNLGTLVKANDLTLYANVPNNPALIGTSC